MDVTTQFDPGTSSIRTSGEYETEAEACAALDAILAKHPTVFEVAKEVRGWYVQGKSRCEPKRPRIDRILIPKRRLLDAGWKHGAIGIEAKTSGKKAGRAVSQALDYHRANFEWRGFLIECDWIFMWPMQRVTNDLGSVMVNNRIGTAEPLGESGIVFMADATRAIQVRDDGDLYVCNELKTGRKMGSR